MGLRRWIPGFTSFPWVVQSPYFAAMLVLHPRGLELRTRRGQLGEEEDNNLSTEVAKLALAQLSPPLIDDPQDAQRPVSMSFGARPNGGPGKHAPAESPSSRDGPGGGMGGTREAAYKACAQDTPLSGRSGRDGALGASGRQKPPRRPPGGSSWPIARVSSEPRNDEGSAQQVKEFRREGEISALAWRNFCRITGNYQHDPHKVNPADLEKFCHMLPQIRWLARGPMREEPEDASDKRRRIDEFLHTWPRDDRARDFLERQPFHIVEQVIRNWEPKNPNVDSFSSKLAQDINWSREEMGKDLLREARDYACAVLATRAAPTRGPASSAGGSGPTRTEGGGQPEPTGTPSQTPWRKPTSPKTRTKRTGSS